MTPTNDLARLVQALRQQPDGSMGIFEILITGDKNNLRSRQG